MDEIDKNNLKVLIRSYYAIQSLRISSANQLELKSDGSSQSNSKGRTRSLSASETLNRVLSNTKDSEKILYTAIKKSVEDTDEWKYFLKDVKGCGPVLSAILMTEIDIRKANTVSAIWQYAGTNPAKNVKGRKYVDGKIVVTDDLIKGDKLTKGYLAPYNKFLKTAILGKLGDSFIKTNSPYRKYYDDYKYRLEHSDAISTSTGKPWKDCSKLHISAAANRHMCQQFLIDYYRAIRQLYGLEVRVPYSEEYLNKTHHTKYVELPEIGKVTRIDQLGLSVRSTNILTNTLGMKDIEDLRNLDLSTLKVIKGCGKKCIEEITNKFRELGI